MVRIVNEDTNCSRPWCSWPCCAAWQAKPVALLTAATAKTRLALRGLRPGDWRRTPLWETRPLTSAEVRAGVACIAVVLSAA